MNLRWLLPLILLTGCGGGQGTDPLPTDCSATLTWQPPSQTLDGTPITVDDISKFTIFMSEQLDTDDIYKEMEIDISNTYIITWEVKNISKGQHYFYMTATDFEDNISAYSNILGKLC